MTLKEARANGETFYIGKVCKHHPELAGQRRSAQGNCPSCIVERMQKHRAKNRKAYNRKRRERNAAIRDGAHVPRKYRRASEVVT